MSEENYFRILETAVVVVLFLIARGVIGRLIDRTLTDKLFQESRGKAIKRVVNAVMTLLCIVFVLAIWGVRQGEIAVFAGSVLAVVGVALVAQWSLLSNVTSSIILFFNHPVKLDDHIIIMEGKDYGIEGRVVGIGLFFVTLDTQEDGEITLPNNVFIQKTIRKVSQPSSEKEVQLDEAED